MTVYYSIQLDQPPTPENAKKLQAFTLNYLKDVTPVRTGLLRRSWDVSVDGAQVNISNPVYYAGFVDGGTRKMAARQMTTQTEQPTIDFANELDGISSFVNDAKAEGTLSTGDAELDALIADTVKGIIGDVVSPEQARQQLGLTSIGDRTLKRYNPKAKTLADDPILQFLEELSGGILGIDPTRYRTLLEEYGYVNTTTDITGVVETLAIQ